ncbi:MAG: hypothetical protein D6710_07370 [Nitrospirae bacterium]|nr:MAG: hypothetical protein D6710_07370 [Nitrospirota bacterium]
MILDSYNKELAETYKVLANIFTRLPDEELVDQLRDELELEIKDPIDSVIEDYTQLFYGPQSPLTPVESLYHYKNTPSYWNETTEEVADFYRSCGLELDDESTELPPDHIAIEFLFVSYLLENNMIDELRRFFNEHIMQWIPSYCDTLKKRAQTDFYRELASVTKEVVLSDYEELFGE